MRYLKSDSTIELALELPAYQALPAFQYDPIITMENWAQATKEGKVSQSWEQFISKKKGTPRVLSCDIDKRRVRVEGDEIPAHPAGNPAELDDFDASGWTTHHVNEIEAAIIESLRGPAPSIDAPFHERVIFRARTLAETIAPNVVGLDRLSKYYKGETPLREQQRDKTVFANVRLEPSDVTILKKVFRKHPKGVTYDDIQNDFPGIGRGTISARLPILIDAQILERTESGRVAFSFDGAQWWGNLPKEVKD